MARIIGVRFKPVGRVYYFDPGEFKIEKDMHVIVETARGVEFGYVVIGEKDVDDSEIVHPLKQVIRIATDKDVEKHEENAKKEKDAFKICEEKIAKHNM